jgi:hypothetical protein
MGRYRYGAGRKAVGKGAEMMSFVMIDEGGAGRLRVMLLHLV